MDGVERYSKWIRAYEDWVRVGGPLPSSPKRKEKKGIVEEVRPSIEPIKGKSVYESPFYEEYQRYLAAARGRSPKVGEFREPTPSIPIWEEVAPVPRIVEGHDDFWRAYDAIAREVIRREGHGGFIHRPSEGGRLVLNEEDDQETIRSKIDSLVSEWSYWGLGMEEGIEVARKSKKILTQYLYDRLKGGDLSIYSEYGDDLIGYWPLMEEAPKKEEKKMKEESIGERVTEYMERAKEYAFATYKNLKDLFERMTFPLYTTEYVA